MRRSADGIDLLTGLKIRDVRKAQGLTQEQLATRAGIGRTTLTNMEKGWQVVPLTHLVHIAEVLQIHPGSLLPIPGEIVHVDVSDAYRAEVKQWRDRVMQIRRLVLRWPDSEEDTA